MIGTRISYFISHIFREREILYEAMFVSCYNAKLIYLSHAQFNKNKRHDNTKYFLFTKQKECLKLQKNKYIIYTTGSCVTTL